MARWDLEADLPGGTNADIIIGGCDKNGNIVYNDISRMIINSYKKYHFANPKLQVRISAKHPDEFLLQVGELAGMGLNVLSIFNDDVIIPANQKQGKSLEDCPGFMLQVAARKSVFLMKSTAEHIPILILCRC